MMYQKNKKGTTPFKSINQREKFDVTFEQRYRAMLSDAERMERIELVSARLSEKYGSYEAAKLFVDYLRATDEIFARAQDEDWTVELTEQKMIEGEILLMSRHSGIDEQVFYKIYDDFQALDDSARKVQIAAKLLIEKYEEKCFEECIQFINYIKDYLLIFSEAISNHLTLDETKEKIIKMRMRVLAENSDTPVHILESIYREFDELLRQSM